MASGHIPQNTDPHPPPRRRSSPQKDVRRNARRRHRGQRPTATVDPNTKQQPRRPSRHCSRVRWPRFPHVAPKPHPSRHGSASASTPPVTSSKKSFGEAFGTATGVSDPRLQKIRIRNINPSGQAAAVAGYAGPGFHHWPSGHIPQNTDPHPLPRRRSSPQKRRSEKRSAPQPGSATHGYRKSGSETSTQAAKPPL